MSEAEDRFLQAFKAALAQAAQAAGVAAPVAPDALVELHLNGVHELGVEEAARAMFVGPDEFFQAIDVSVHPKHPDGRHFFVQIEAHAAVPWEGTLQPEGLGPFNVVIPG